MSNPSIQLAANLASTKGLRPTPEWLATFMNSQRPTTPFQSLVQTATFRLLASDFTQSLNRDACLPVDIAASQVQERKIAGTIPLQILGIEDISKSRWEQIEEIEALERGEGTRGREIIRVTENPDGTEEPVTSKDGLHKVLLQDAAGNRVYGIESSPVDGVSLGTNIGAKLLLVDATAARGMILLSHKCVKLLGGKIDAYHKIWRQNRKADLKRGIEEQG